MDPDSALPHSSGEHPANQPRTEMRRRLPIRHRVRRLLASGIALLLAACASLEIAVRCILLPPGLLRPAQPTPVLVDCHGDLLARPGTASIRDQRPVALAQMAPTLVQATVGLEDRRFWQHHGIDVRGIAAAFWMNLKHGRILAGASTITQQLIKNTSPPEPRTLWTKLTEALRALKLERTWTKQQIIERYLNEIDYGNRLHGVEAASQQYFRKPASDLTASECIFLAGLPQSPSRFNPWSRPDGAKARYARAIAILAAQGLTTEDEAPHVRARQTAPLQAPHYVEAVRARCGTAAGGTIACTLDLSLQTQVNAIVQRHAAQLAMQDAQQIAAVVLDHDTGAVRAWCGSTDWESKDGRIDGVTLPRSCGSVLKPLVYLRGIDSRALTAATVLPDTPDAARSVYADYDPRNFDQRYWGPVRVREALASSLNVPAIIALSRIGARDTCDFLQHAGIRMQRGFDSYGAGMVLGNADVRLLDVAAAFSAFARDGRRVMPRVMESEEVRHHVIASAEAAQIIADILCDDGARRKTFPAFTPLAFEGGRIPVKTGTSSGFRDAWTIGMTGRHVVGVWVGNFSGRPMQELAAIGSAAPVWRDIIDCLLARGDPDVPAPVPNNSLQQTQVCGLSGLLPAVPSKTLVSEWFMRGTEPGASASTWFDPEGRPLLPPEYAEWCASAQNHLHATALLPEGLRIAQPRDGATFVFDRALPRERQQLGLRVIGAQVTKTLEWRMDGELIGHTHGGDLTWSLSKGLHELAVCDGDHEARVHFSVE